MRNCQIQSEKWIEIEKILIINNKMLEQKSLIWNKILNLCNKIKILKDIKEVGIYIHISWIFIKSYKLFLIIIDSVK